MRKFLTAGSHGGIFSTQDTSFLMTLACVKLTHKTTHYGLCVLTSSLPEVILMCYCTWEATGSRLQSFPSALAGAGEFPPMVLQNHPETITEITSLQWSAAEKTRCAPHCYRTKRNKKTPAHIRYVWLHRSSEMFLFLFLHNFVIEFPYKYILGIVVKVRKISP